MSVEGFVGGGPAEALEGVVVDVVGDVVEVVLGEVGQVGALGQVASDEPVDVFVGAAFVGAVGVAVVDGYGVRVEQVWAVVLVPVVEGDGVCRFGGRGAKMERWASRVAWEVTVSTMCVARNCVVRSTSVWIPVVWALPSTVSPSP